MTLAVEPNDLAMARNLRNLTAELERRIREWELRYELNSFCLEAELAAHRIRETDDISKWVVTWRTFLALVDERGQATSVE